jgi:hypothetical protein
MALRLRRGTEAERGSVIFQEGELVYVTDTKDLYAGDGVTPGGIKVSNVGSPDALTQNLDLDGFNIFGSGSITATAFIGDGSGLTNLPIGPGGIIEGANYRINIVGNDSSTIVNSATNTLTGLFVGDGSNITNILLEQLDDAFISFPSNGEVLTYTDGFWVNAPATGGEGIVAGGDYQINIVGTDSTRIVDTSTNTLTGNLSSNQITYSTSLDVNNNIDGVIGQVTLNNSGEAQYLKFIRTDTGTATNQTLGLIGFDQVDETGTTTYTSMAFWHSGIYIANSSTGIFAPTNYLGFEDGNLCIGDYSAADGYRLDVRGNAVIVDGSLKFNESRNLIDISPASLYELTVDINNNTLAFYDGIEWRNIVASGSTAFETVLPGGLFIGAYDQATINSFGLDSANITGSMVYNSDSDRFEFFQSGSWIPLANQELEETSDVRFASVTADSFISTGAGTPTLESATNLDLQAGNAVRVIGAPFRLANLNSTQRTALTPANGDMIYNTTANRIQAYQNGSWINLDDGTSA